LLLVSGAVRDEAEIGQMGAEPLRLKGKPQKAPRSLHWAHFGIPKRMESIPKPLFGVHYVPPMAG
jgi:hypothetical protein